jgi:hypothetical protein
MGIKQCNAGRSRETWKGKKKKEKETSQMVKVLNLFIILASLAIRRDIKHQIALQRKRARREPKTTRVMMPILPQSLLILH